MAIVNLPKVAPRIVDKTVLREWLEEHNRAVGFHRTERLSPTQIRTLMREDGIRAEDNVFSREVAAMREEGLEEVLEEAG